MARLSKTRNKSIFPGRSTKVKSVNVAAENIIDVPEMAMSGETDLLLDIAEPQSEGSVGFDVLNQVMNLQDDALDVVESSPNEDEVDADEVATGAALSRHLEPHLPDPETTGPAQSTPTLQGYIDQADETRIAGWVWDPQSPAKRIRLGLFKDNKKLTETVADINRTGLILPGASDSKYAFSIALKDQISSDEHHILHLQCMDTGAAMPGSPILIDPIQRARQPSLQWYLDEISDTQISGWIMVRDDPSRRCVVALMEKERILARAVASRFRPDLVNAGIGDGCYSFALEMPRPLLDGNEHLLDVIEQESGTFLNSEPIRWRSTAGTAGIALTGLGHVIAPNAEGAGSSSARGERPPVLTRHRPVAPSTSDATRVRTSGRSRQHVDSHATTRMIFDISDLVYYIGHHPNLTGIQRVQSSIVLSIVNGNLLSEASVIFLSFNAKSRRWAAIPTGFLISLLQDLFLPEPLRLVAFDADEARYGLLPGARDFDGVGQLDDGRPSVLCLLGAAWVQRDYFHRILSFKRRFGTRFVMMIHDLIPIYARETCDQGTARVFEEFLRRAVRHVDHYLSVSESTARDLRRYFGTMGLPEPTITVTRNGSSFDEFLSSASYQSDIDADDIPERFVLFVATIEGRKNHQLILDVWRRMIGDGDDVPHLVCVGRVGWKSQKFVAEIVETNYLNGKAILMQDVSDARLNLLYRRCLFSVCPSLYEGWGLPIGESLAAGKICVCSNRSSLPEVAGEFGIYIDVDDADRWWQIIRNLIVDEATRRELEEKICSDYEPTKWRQVAERIVDACHAGARTEWHDPYPYPAIPYSSEVSFAWLGRDEDGTFGDDMLTRIADTRKGYFLREPLQEQSFFRGEDARSGGLWAEPENWGTWLCHSGGDIVLGLEADESQLYYVFLRLRVSGPISNLNVRIAANGESVWNGTLGPRPKDIVLRVWKRIVAPGGCWRLRIQIDTDLSADMLHEVLAIDSRAPTIGFERLVVVPDADLKTRVDILYTLIL